MQNAHLPSSKPVFWSSLGGVIRRTADADDERSTVLYRRFNWTDVKQRWWWRWWHIKSGWTNGEEEQVEEEEKE